MPSSLAVATIADPAPAVPLTALVNCSITVGVPRAGPRLYRLAWFVTLTSMPPGPDRVIVSESRTVSASTSSSWSPSGNTTGAAAND